LRRNRGVRFGEMRIRALVNRATLPRAPINGLTESVIERGSYESAAFPER
jgi:hypothetical protein